jgi:ornithine--oxo-acid transaminase
MKHLIDFEDRYGSRNYKPLPVVLTKAKGVYVWDHNGKRYLDMMSAYSAVSFGHCNPRLVKTLTKQANTLSVVSRAFHTDKLGLFLEKACTLFKFDKGLPMNSGAEAVETALKAARKWGYKVKGIPNNKAEIISAENNFHGRTIAVIGMSTTTQYRNGFGPFPKGLKTIPYGDSAALEKAINKNTAAFLIESIQGEGGIVLPPKGYLKECARICKKHNVLLIVDEIQTGLGRTGKLLACHHEKVHPDAILLGKALGGGMLAVSLFLARKEVMNVFTPGDHGSTFGGNALASAVGLESLKILQEQKLSEHAAKLGIYFLKELKKIKSPLIKEVRGKGLFIGIEVDRKKTTAAQMCLNLLEAGILTKDTHHTVLRFAPPLTITKAEINNALKIIKRVFTQTEEK